MKFLDLQNGKPSLKARDRIKGLTHYFEKKKSPCDTGDGAGVKKNVEFFSIYEFLFSFLSPQALNSLFIETNQNGS